MGPLLSTASCSQQVARHQGTTPGLEAAGKGNDDPGTARLSIQASVILWRLEGGRAADRAASHPVTTSQMGKLKL